MPLAHLTPRVALLAACLYLTAPGALAQPAQPAAPSTAATPAAAPDAAWTLGEVRRVNAAAGTLTLRHEDIRSLDMPGMTMAFDVKDKAWLQDLKAGDKMRFQVVEEQGQLVITALERAP